MAEYHRGGLTHRARALRRDMTPAERAVWRRLRGDQMGIRFRRQLVFERRFILDFYAPSARLCVEIDGGQHLGRLTDRLRDAYLARRGVRVLRFWSDEVSENLEGVLQTIRSAVMERV